FAFKRCGFADHLPWNAHHHGVGRDLHSFLADRTGGNDRARPDANAVQQNRAHADQRIRLDDGTMNDRAMTDADAVADDGGEAAVGVDNGSILDVAVLSYLNPFRVPSQ